MSPLSPFPAPLIPCSIELANGRIGYMARILRGGRIAVGAEVGIVEPVAPLTERA